MQPITVNECSFCDNTSDPNYDVHYEKTGLVRHCVHCAMEFGIDQTHPVKLSTEVIHKPVDEIRHAV